MTAPIAFTPLPRVAGTELADTPAAQNRFAPHVEANFDRINPYAGAFPERLKVRRVSGSNLLGWNAKWTWYSAAETGVEGWLIGDVRMMSIIAKYTGASILADSYGSIIDQPMATLRDGRFLPGGNQQLCVGASYAAGTAGLVLTETGVLTLITISEGKSSLDPNDWVSFIVTYLVR